MTQAERMRDAAARAARDARRWWRAARAARQTAPGRVVRVTANAIAEVIRSLPLPAPTPVEDAERRFVQACETSCRLNLSGVTREGERAAEVVIEKYRALLAARQQERAKGGSDERA